MRIKSRHKVLHTMPDPEGCSESDSFFSTLKKSLWLTFVECFLYSWNDSKRVIWISSSNPLRSSGRSLVAQMVKNLSAMQETWVWSLSSEDLLEKGMATHSSILTWRIPWTEEPGRLQSIGLPRLSFHRWQAQYENPAAWDHCDIFPGHIFSNGKKTEPCDMRESGHLSFDSWKAYLHWLILTDLDVDCSIQKGGALWGSEAKAPFVLRSWQNKGEEKRSQWDTKSLLCRRSLSLSNFNSILGWCYFFPKGPMDANIRPCVDIRFI